jgi:hypothetical protein
LETGQSIITLILCIALSSCTIITDEVIEQKDLAKDHNDNPIEYYSVSNNKTGACQSKASKTILVNGKTVIIRELISCEEPTNQTDDPLPYQFPLIRLEDVYE